MPEFDKLTIPSAPISVEDWNSRINEFYDFFAELGKILDDKTLSLGASKISHEDNTLRIKDTLNIVNKNTDSKGTTLVLGPTNQSNLRLGYNKEYSWIQSHGSKPLAINPLGNNIGIGTAAPKFRVHISAPKHLGHLLLEDRDKKTGLHFHVNADTAFITNRNNFAKNGISKNRHMILSTPEVFKIQTSNKADPYLGHTRLMIIENGFTGIGTEDPRNTLHIKGNKGMLVLEGKKAASITFYQKGLGYLSGYLGFALENNSNLYFINRVEKADIVMIGKQDILMTGGRDFIFNTKKIKAPVGGNNKKLEPPFLFKKYTFKQTGNNKVVIKSTKISHAHWTAAVVGFSTGLADIGEKGTGTSMEVKMVKKAGNSIWHIQANLRTQDNSLADWTVQVMFVQNQFCKTDDDYDAADPTPTIPTTGFPPFNF